MEGRKAFPWTSNCFLQNLSLSTCTVYFGDLFSVLTDGLAGPAAPPSDELEFKCPNCKEPLTAQRQQMLLIGKKKLPAVVMINKGKKEWFKPLGIFERDDLVLRKREGITWHTECAAGPNAGRPFWCELPESAFDVL